MTRPVLPVLAFAVSVALCAVATSRAQTPDPLASSHVPSASTSSVRVSTLGVPPSRSAAPAQSVAEAATTVIELRTPKLDAGAPPQDAAEVNDASSDSIDEQVERAKTTADASSPKTLGPVPSRSAQPPPGEVGSSAPASASLPPVASAHAPGSPRCAPAVKPESDETQGRGTLALILGAGLALLLSHGARRMTQKLPPKGIVPFVLAVAQELLRLVPLVVAVVLVGQWLPDSARPAGQWLIFGVAAAVGWSARDFLPDILAGLLLHVERRVKPGMWVAIGDDAGEVCEMGLRSTWLRVPSGQRVRIPNRRFVADTLAFNGDQRPAVEVAYRAAPDAIPERVREALYEAALLSPWRWGGKVPEVLREASDPLQWRVRVCLLEGRFAAPLETALVFHVERILSGQGTMSGG